MKSSKNDKLALNPKHYKNMVSLPSSQYAPSHSCNCRISLNDILYILQIVYMPAASVTSKRLFVFYHSARLHKRWAED